MKRLSILLLLVIALTPALPAQDADKPTEDKPAGEEPKTEKEPSAEIPADFADYIRRVWPGIDPAGEHNLADLKNYTEEAKRHDYTGKMAQLIGIYLGTLQMGPALQQLFDHYSRSKFAESPTFQVLYSVLLLQYPPGMQNVERAHEMLKRVTQTNKDYAYAWYYLAQLELGLSQQRGQLDVPGALKTIDKAIAIKDDFAAARYFKADLLFKTSRDHAEVVAVLEPVLKGKLTMSADSYNELMRLYVSVASESAFEEMVKAHRARPEFTVRHQARVGIILAIQCIPHPDRTDKALGILAEIEQVVTPSTDPEVAILTHRMSASFCFQKLVEIGRTQPDAKEEFNKVYDELVRHHREAVEIEETHLPMAMRGAEAVAYVEVLMKVAERKPSAGLQQQEREKALLWLDTYLKETELPANSRRRLENLHANIHLMLNPTEEGYIRKLENYEAAKDNPKILVELAVKREAVRRDMEKFTLKVSLDFFVRHINSSDDSIVRNAAYLASHTARQRGGEAIAIVGKAIADRFEKLSELNSEAQYRLLDDLGLAMRDLGDKAGLERVVRQIAVIAGSDPASRYFSQLMAGWIEREFLNTIPNAPKALRSTYTHSPSKCVDWLKELAEAIKKAREDEERG